MHEHRDVPVSFCHWLAVYLRESPLYPAPVPQFSIPDVEHSERNRLPGALGHYCPEVCLLDRKPGKRIYTKWEYTFTQSVYIYAKDDLHLESCDGTRRIVSHN